MNKQLTKKMLEEMGITNVYWDEDNNQWWIDRYWRKWGNLKSDMVHKRINVSIATCRHKYTEDKVYPVVNFSYNGKGKSYPLARFLYAWFHGEVKEGEEVDHIDNDPFNNKLENLQVLTREENLRKRFTDHEGVRCFNQFYNTLKIDTREPKVRVIGYRACQVRWVLGINNYALKTYVKKGLIRKLANNRYCIEDVENLRGK